MFRSFNALAAVSTIALALAFGNAHAAAQEPRTNDQTATTAIDTRRDDGFNWGWLGLAGLVGLLGLMPRNRGGLVVRDGAGNVKDSARR